MRMTIDTSAILAVVLNQAEKESIVGITVDAELIAPASVKWEVGNALSSLFKRKKISENEIESAIDQYHSIPIRFENPDLKYVLTFCIKHQIYAYDAYVIACAKELRTPVLTLDLAMRAIAEKEKMKLVEV